MTAAAADAPQPAAPSASAWFDDATEKLGLKFVHDVGDPAKYFMPTELGSGVALFDYDNDGRLDIYLLQGAGPDSKAKNQLWHQEADGHFTDVSAGSGADITGYGIGVAVGDVNNDGRPDLLVTEYGRIRLLLNDGNGKFHEVATAASGLDNPYWATSAAFVDYDRDGWLDLVVANYVDYDTHRPCFDQSGKQEFCAPNQFAPGEITKLFHNLGAQGKPGVFEDVTQKSGLGSVRAPALGVICADFDGDGWPDIFVTDDGQPNRLWMNQHNGTFKDEAAIRGVALSAMGQSEANMGIALGDVDGDGTFDLLVTHLIQENSALWAQGPRGTFQDRRANSGLAGPKWHGTGWGAVFGDFRNSGTLDLAIANGAFQRNNLDQPAAETVKANGAFWAPYAQRSQLFENNGKGVFRDVSLENAPFCAAARVSRGLSSGDLNNDGGLDLVVTNLGAAARIYRNLAQGRGHWLLVRAIDPNLGGRDAYGAEITVTAGGQHWKRWCNPAGSFLSSNDPRAHFGLGEAAQVDAIDVLWPDGASETFPATPADRIIVLSKGQGIAKR